MPASRLPLWSKIAYTVVVAVVIPVYGVRLGPTNFLWFSDVALILMLVALWRESCLLGSMMAVMTLPLEIGWAIGFILGLVGGTEWSGFAAYMFDPETPLLIRILSGSFHIALLIALLASIARLGYDPRALKLQVPLTWLVLVLTWFLNPATENINYVRGIGQDDPEPILPQPFHFLALLIAIPLALHLPTHLVLRRWWSGCEPHRK